MTLKEKMKTYSFWLSLASCILLIVKTIAEQFGYTLSNNLITNIITGVCSVLVLFGLIASPHKKQSLKEIEEDANQILNEQEQTINQIKEDAKIAMEKFEDMTIAEQIEYLKRQLAEAEEKKVVEEQVIERHDSVSEQVVQEEEKMIDESHQEVQIEQEVVKEPEVEQEVESKPQEELGLEELKKLVYELLSRI